MFKKQTKIDSDRETQKLLRRNGLKATLPRRAILKTIANTAKPLSIREIIDTLDGAYNKTTVYRFMNRLKHIGIIKQIDLRHNHAHFELARTDDHHHLVCIHCSFLEDVADCSVEDMYNDVLKRSSRFAFIKQHALEFYGVCKHCTKNIPTGQ